jgi:hypothetical protein
MRRVWVRESEDTLLTRTLGAVWDQIKKDEKVTLLEGTSYNMSGRSKKEDMSNMYCDNEEFAEALV